ncbi:hypothetical protein PGTUg99_009018 [Puccinia graminis f. sp. tritici]|uniref:Protein kinase domain-containing protein n=1 Tax=Puccinia graminis f. sp. tritici TaxID=56615 RepID=A0A5B0RVC2_PUCGR|nr:hypothetical protein PGTUg99_009018 [Puccinia graminis f. sp. tritici]
MSHDRTRPTSSKLAPPHPDSLPTPTSKQHQPQAHTNNPFLNALPTLDHRLDIAPSPSPPPHFQPLHHHHHSTSTPPTTSHYLPDHQSPPPPIHLLQLDPELDSGMPLPPPPPKKRERTMGSDQNGSGNTPLNDSGRTLLTNRPAKKEKPAPVTMVYRGAPDDHPYAFNQNQHRQHPLNPSVTALAPQTAINRGYGSMDMDDAPPSTAAPSYSLSHATEASLMKRKHNRLRDLCRERGLLTPSRELTKREMVQALLSWREANLGQRSSGFSETDDSMMSSASGYDTDDHVRSHPNIQERSFEDSIDPQLYSPELNPGIYNLRPRNGASPPKLAGNHAQSPGNYPQQAENHQETIRSSAQPRTRMAIPDPFNNNRQQAVHSPHSQLANFLAATGLQHQYQLDPSIRSPTNDPQPAKKTPPAQPVEEPAVMSHPPMIPLLDDPSRNSKRGSIRLVGTKVPSIGPIGKMSMSSINVAGDGPMSITEPRTMKGGVHVTSTAVAPGTVVMKSSSPPSPPASTETQDDDGHAGSQSHRPRPSPPEDLDVLLDLEDLKLSDKEIPPEKLTREHKVGSGSFKDVYMGRYRNFRVAICDLRGRLTDMDIKELGLLRDLRHPNIVRFIGVSIGGTIPCTIVTELCRNGDLYDYIRKIPCPSYVQILGLMLDAARGVEYLHLRTPSIIHRDLKSPNVLITANGSAKITDFGLARVKRDVMSMCATTCGTLNWQAPELWVAHPSYNHSIDVYALGLVFWEVLCWPFKEKTYPFQGMNEHAIFEEVGKKKLRPSTSMVRRKWGREIVGLIDRMWDNESDARPAMPEVVRLLKGKWRTSRRIWDPRRSQSRAENL